LPAANYQRALEYLSGTWGLPGDVTDIHLDPLISNDKPFRLAYHVHRADFFRVPNSGVSFSVLPPTIAAGMLRLQKTRGQDALNIGPSEEQIFTARIELPPNYSIHIPAGVKIVRDFGEYSSSYLLNKNVLTVERRMALKVNELPATRRSDYESFRT